MATTTTRVQTLGADARRNAEKGVKMFSGSIESVMSGTERIRDEFGKRAEDAADQTRRRAAKLALSVIDFQKTTFDNSFKLISQIQQQSESMINDVISEAGWMPKEGKEIVDEWQKMLRTARNDFQRTIDKSFDLISDYLERIQKDGMKPARKTAKKPAGKKPSVRKVAAKKTAAKKPAAKKPAARKPAARKPAAKKSAAS